MGTKELTKKNRFIKASTAVVLTASTAVGALPIGVEASGFSDVKESQYYYDAVKNLTERGIIKGYSDGTFRPNQNVTRGQAAKIIAGVLQLDTVNVANPNFKDVPTTHPYYGEIAALKAAGIINGFPDGTFRSSAPIERNHMAKILSIALNLHAENEDELPFTDVSQGYKTYIAALYENGITTGATSTTYGGRKPVMRGQLAAFIGRAEKIAPTPTEKVTLEIVEVTGTKLITASGEYEITPDLQAYLNKMNNDALKDAVVEAQVEGKAITEVSSLALNLSGTADKALIFNGGNAEIAGGLTINGDFIEVQNFAVKGDLTITDAAVTSLKLTNVTVGGLTKIAAVKANVTASLKTVANTASRLTITIADSELPSLQVSRSGVTIISDSQLGAVEVNDLASDITLNANVGSLTISTANQFSLAGSGSIETITIKGDVDGQPVNINWTGTITNFETDVPIRLEGDVSNLTITNLVIPFNKTIEDMFVTEDGKLPNIESAIYPDGTPAAKDPGDGGGGIQPGPGDGEEGETPPGSDPGDGGGETPPGPSPGDGGGGTTPSPSPGNGGGGITPPVFVASSKTIANTIDELGIVATTPSSSNSLVATAQISGNNVVISGKSTGSVTIMLKDGTGKIATIAVTVTSGHMTTSVTKFYENTTEELTNNFEVLGLINASKASTSDVVDVNFENGAVNFKAIKPGPTTIILSNEKGHSAKVYISVASNGKLTIGKIQKYTPTIKETITLQQLGLSAQPQPALTLKLTTDNVATVNTSGDSLVISPIWTGVTILEVKDGDKLAKVSVTVASDDTVTASVIGKYENKTETLSSNDIGFTILTKDAAVIMDEPIATATVTQDAIIVTAVKPGSTKLKVQDNAGRTTILGAKVSADGSLQIFNVDKYENKSLEAKDLNVKATKFVYQATSADTASTTSDVVEATTSGDSLIITAKAPGKAIVTVSDNVGRIATIAVEVAANGMIVETERAPYENTSVLFIDGYMNSFVPQQVQSKSTTVATAEIKNNITSADTVKVTAVADGKANIKLTDKDNREMTYVVIVENGVISLVPEETVLYKEEDYKTLTNDVNTLGTKMAYIENTSPKVATVQFTSGKAIISITANKPGTSTVTLTDTDGRLASFTITVKPTGLIELSQITKYEAETKQMENSKNNFGLIALGSIVTTQDIVNVVVSSTNISITAAKPGRTDIVLLNEDNKRSIIPVTVNTDGSITLGTIIKYSDETITVPKNKLGPIGAITAITPSNSSYITVTNETDGIKIVAKKVGTETITITGDNNRQAKIVVTVSSTGNVATQITPYVFDEKEFTLTDLNLENFKTHQSDDNNVVIPSIKDGKLVLKSVNPGSAQVTVKDDKNKEAKINVSVSPTGEMAYTILKFMAETDMRTFNNEETLGFKGQYVFFSTDDTTAVALTGVKSTYSSNDTIAVDLASTSGKVAISPIKHGTTYVYITDDEGRLAKLTIEVEQYGKVRVTDIVKFNNVATDIANTSTIFNLDTSAAIKATFTTDTTANITSSSDVANLSQTSQIVDVNVHNNNVSITPKKPGTTVVYLTDKHDRSAKFTVTVSKWGEITTSNQVAYSVRTEKISVANSVTNIDAISVESSNTDRILATLSTQDSTVTLMPTGDGAKVVYLTLRDIAGREAIVKLNVTANDQITHLVEPYKHSQGANLTTTAIGFEVGTFTVTTVDTTEFDNTTSDVAYVTHDVAGITFTADKPGAIHVTLRDPAGREAIVKATVDADGTISSKVVTGYKNETVKFNNNRTTLGVIGNTVLSTDENVAVASIQDGRVNITALKPGSTTITVKNNETRKATILIVVNKYGTITKKEINKYVSPVKELKMEHYGFTATTVDSSDVTVATVKINGSNLEITPLSNGHTTITMKDSDNREAIIPINVASDDTVTVDEENVIKYESEVNTEILNSDDGLRKLINGKYINLFVGFKATHIVNTSDVVAVSLKPESTKEFLEVSALKPGEATFVVKNNEGRPTTISLQVTKHGAIIYKDVQQFKAQQTQYTNESVLFGFTGEVQRVDTDPTIVKATRGSELLTFESVNPGTSIVKIESTLGEIATMSFTVGNDGSITFVRPVKFALTPSATTTNDVATLGMTAVNDPAKLTSSNSSFKAEIVNDKIKITPTAYDKNARTTTITLEDAAGRTATIQAEVLQTGHVVVNKITKFGSNDNVKTFTNAQLGLKLNATLNTSGDTVQATYDSGNLTIKGEKPGTSIITLTGTNGVVKMIAKVSDNGSVSINQTRYLISNATITTSGDVLTVTFSEAIDYSSDIRATVGTVVVTKDSMTVDDTKKTLTITFPEGYTLNYSDEIILDGIKFDGSSLELRFELDDYNN